MRRSRDSDSVGAVKSDVTPEITGEDAGRDGAEPGNVGGGEPAGDPDDIEKHEFRLEKDPAHPEDIPPDHLEKADAGAEEEEREQQYTARPKNDLRPITLDLLP
jgi:hypothetical protein